jgi:uncharacterized protein (TIGR02453 family)
MSDSFPGFSKECVKFFKELASHNHKTWFDKNKAEYNEEVLEPSRHFVTTMGDRLKKLRPKVVADPRINKSLFRIYRDTRFSKDKSPYKTHMGIIFWEGTGKRMDCSSFYFHIEPGKLMLGAGLYHFPKNLIEPYRDAVVHKKHGPTLARAVAKAKKAGYDIGGVHYKRTPRGYDPDHKLAPLLLHKGLYAMAQTKIPRELYSEEIIDYCFKTWKPMVPLHEWMVGLTKGEKS